MASSASADVSTDEATALTIELEAGDSQRPPAATPPPAGVRCRDRLGRRQCGGLRRGGLPGPRRRRRGTRSVFQGVPQPNGWVALDSDGDIYLVRPGQDARRLEVAGSDTADDSCPTWSPDGTRLSFGRLTGSSDTASSDAELVIVPVGRDGAIGAPNVIALDGFHALPGFDPHPCATWAPDGRWVAFVGSGDVWVADTQTGAIRRLPDLRPIDLEWRPGTDELAIAGDIGPNRAADDLVHAGHRLLRVDRRAPPTRLRSSRKPHVVARRLDVGVPGRRERHRRALAGRRRRRQRTVAHTTSAPRTTASVPCGPRPVNASPTNASDQRDWRTARGRPRERCRWERDGH